MSTDTDSRQYNGAKSTAGDMEELAGDVDPCTEDEGTPGNPASSPGDTPDDDSGHL
jgi:hypothetical protein